MNARQGWPTACANAGQPCGAISGFIKRAGIDRPFCRRAAPKAKSAPSGMSSDAEQSTADCSALGESERHAGREVERKPKAQRGSIFRFHDFPKLQRAPSRTIDS
ncbi:hypothetical protein ACFOEY_08880 [Paracandidimonas soli]|uniref:hypothetical protein n=1 Tax=Paracandidimonas soli TaxID=1917182 RepID=UPI00361E241D